MSISDEYTPDGCGQSDGSRKSRFSSDNQPARRRQPKKRKDLKASLVAQLRRPVKVQVGGETKTIEYMDAFNQSLSQDLLRASVSDKLKFLDKMQKLGLSSLLKDQAKLDAERAEVEDLRRNLHEQRHMEKLSAQLNRGLAEHWRLQSYITVQALIELSESCQCEAHSDELVERIDTLIRTHEQSLEADAHTEEMLKMLRDDLRDDHSDDDGDDGDGDLDDYDDEGGVEYDPHDFDEDAMPNTHDPDDPALDIANGELTPEDLIPPASSDDGEDRS